MLWYLIVPPTVVLTSIIPPTIVLPTVVLASIVLPTAILNHSCWFALYSTMYPCLTDCDETFNVTGIFAALRSKCQ